MTYAADHSNCSAPKASPKRDAIAKKLSVLWRRIFDAVIESRQKSVEREVALWLARSGGRITDNIEREITESLMTGNFKIRD